MVAPLMLGLLGCLLLAALPMAPDSVPVLVGLVFMAVAVIFLAVFLMVWREKQRKRAQDEWNHHVMYDSEGGAARVMAPVAGTARAVSVKEEDRVKQGQVLAMIYYGR